MDKQEIELLAKEIANFIVDMEHEYEPSFTYGNWRSLSNSNVIGVDRLYVIWKTKQQERLKQLQSGI